MSLKGRGFLITFEGIEGTGKTTQIKKLQHALKNQRYHVTATCEPGGTSFGKKLRHFLVGGRQKKIPAESELFLFLADRAYHVQNLINQALHKRQVVLCDRFIDSTIAYQAFGRNLSKKLLDGMNKLATGGLQPDLTFFLDLPVQAALKRVRKRGNANRMDRESASFYSSVRKGYYFLARKNARIAIIDATLPPEVIEQEILKKVKTLLESRNG